MRNMSLGTLCAVLAVIALFLALPACPPDIDYPEPGERRQFSSIDGRARIDFVWVPAGSFLMGGDLDDEDRESGELPQHEVTISEGFWMSRTEVTKEQYFQVMGHDDPWHNQENVLDDPDSPAVYITIRDADDFVDEINEDFNGDFYLPSEGQWEWACRAGTTTRYYYGDDPNGTALEDYAWYSVNAAEADEPYAHVVRSKGQDSQNPWGLFDMLGNAWEWTQDHYSTYPDDAETDPIVRTWKGDERIRRGGGYLSTAAECRASARAYGEDFDDFFEDFFDDIEELFGGEVDEDTIHSALGLRICRSFDPKED